MENIHWSWFWNKYKFNKEFSIGRCTSLKKIGLCMYTYYYIYTFLYGRVFFQTESFIFGECNKSHVQQRRKLWNYKSDSAVYLYHFDSWAQVFFSWAKLVNHLDIILRNLSPIDCDYIFYHCRDKCVLGDFCFSTILPSTLTEVTYQSDSDWL